jgi:hypothetical protein
VVVRGRILFQDDAVPFSGATARVTVEDTTYADASAGRVNVWTLEGIAYPDDAAGVEFEIAFDPDPRRRYSLRVLIDVDGDGVLGRGDYRNADALPVGRGVGPIEIRVRRVGR